MYIESLFKLPGVEVVKKPASFYQIWMSRPTYKTVETQLQRIFWDNYQRISLVQRCRRGGKMLIVLMWKRGYVDGGLSRADSNEGD